MSFGTGLKDSQLEEWHRGELLFQSQGGTGARLWVYGRCLLSARLSYVHLLLPLDTSMLAVTFRPSSQSCRADQPVRRKSMQAWCGNPGRKMNLTWKNRTEVAVKLLFQAWHTGLCQRLLLGCKGSFLQALLLSLSRPSCHAQVLEARRMLCFCSRAGKRASVLLSKLARGICHWQRRDWPPLLLTKAACMGEPAALCGPLLQLPLSLLCFSCSPS